MSSRLASQTLSVPQHCSLSVSPRRHYCRGQYLVSRSQTLAGRESGYARLDSIRLADSERLLIVI